MEFNVFRLNIFVTHVDFVIFDPPEIWQKRDDFAKNDFVKINKNIDVIG